MKNINSLLFAALCLWFSAMLESQAQTPRKIASKADKAFFNDEPENALILYEQALIAKPDDIKVNYRLGLLYLNARKPEKAIPVLQKVVKLAPEFDPDYILSLAKAYHQNSNFDEAIVQYQAALARTKKKDEYTILELNKRIQECVSGQNLKALPVTAEVSNLHNPVNSAASEHGVMLFNKDKSLLFTSNRRIVQKKLADENIFQVQFDGKKWTEPKAFDKPINTPEHDAASGISADGNTLYLYKYSNGGDIYQVKRSGSGWSKPEEMPEPINSEFYEPSIFITPDGQYAFFASDRDEGFGGLDLYISLRQPDGSWSEAMNLGPNINTEYDEDAPFITADGKTLYFSSRGHNSMGGYDVFTSNSEGPAWSKAENLGFPVNSPYDDIYLVTTANGSQGYFSSDRAGGAGEKDIYGVTFRNVLATDSMIAVAEPEPELGPVALLVKDTIPENRPSVIKQVAVAKPTVHTILLRGNVTEAGKGVPLAAQLVLTEANQNQSPVYANADSLSGKYQFEVMKGKKYSLVVKKEGYFYTSEKLSLPDAFTNDTVAKNFELRKIKAGAKLVLKNILFEYNSDKLSTDSREELNRLYEMILENPGLSIEISGHTDSRGSVTYNQALSLKRAQSVVDYLNAKGVGSVKLKAVGHGASKPIANNKTESGRKQNRRTEFKILQE